MKILVAYASAYGSTGEIAEFIGRILRTYNVEVDVVDVKNVTSIAEYDAYLMGSAIHGGMWLQPMSVFTRKFLDQLAEKPCYFWITCIRALEADGHEHALRYYFDPQILKGLRVRSIAAFTGKLKTDVITRQELWYLASHYDGRQVTGLMKDDFRDWKAIAIWTSSIATDLHLEPTFASEKQHDVD